MHENDNAKGTRTTTDDTAERLREFYRDKESGTYAERPGQGTLTRLGRALFQLARLAGVEDPKQVAVGDRHTIYERAVARGLTNHPAVQQIRSILDEAAEHRRRAQVERAAEEIRETLGIKHKPRTYEDNKPSPLRYRIDLCDGSARNIGYIAGERIVAEECRDLKTGDAAAAWNRDDPDAFVGRVVADNKKQFTVRNDFGDERAFGRWCIGFAGRVVGTEPKLSDADRKRIDELHAKLDKLGREDDQIIRCTARYKLEKEIFEIEHPREDLDDWREWEEPAGVSGKGGAR